MKIVETIIAQCLANCLDDCDRVLLAVSNFYARFCDNNLDRQYLPKIPQKIIQRPDTGFEVSRHRVSPEYLPANAETEESSLG